MLGQEEIFQLTYKERWSEVIERLSAEKEIIVTDKSLLQAVSIFQKEFLEKASSYSINRKDILDGLETLYLLHHGKYCKLSEPHYKALILELVKRKNLKEAANYAKAFPEEEICKSAIEKYHALRETETTSVTYEPKSNIDWESVFAALFFLISDNQDPVCYFSGPRFIKVVKEFNPFFPNYDLYMDRRKKEFRNLSRRNYFYDILLSFNEETRLKLVSRILEMIRPFKGKNLDIVEGLLGSKKTELHFSENLTLNDLKSPSDRPKIFISYSWDNESHKRWVLKLAKLLSEDGVEVLLDQYLLRLGANLHHFVEDSIKKADRVIAISTTNYRIRAEGRLGGVGYEYSIINAELYRNQLATDKLIPVLRFGSVEESIPTFMQQHIHLDVRDNKNFKNEYKRLIRDIYKEPEIAKPTIGSKPKFV